MRVCRECHGLYGPDQMHCTKDGFPTESHVEVLIGQQLGPYMVRAVIGEGGMGVVYAGEHPTLGKRVALKVLRPELSLRDDIVERFVQEARSVSTIGHSNIVTVYDFGRTPFGSFYIVMEYLDGQTIRSLLDAAGPMPLERVRLVVMGVGAALSAAHAKGFIHRDIKPENIMIVSRARQESVKLLDFGIAKLVTTEGTSKTRTGMAMGTPQYMSPEQLEEAPLDNRADIYSLAAVTYEMLTGRVPFPGKSHAEVRQLQLTRTPTAPSVCRTKGRLSRSLDKAILWALSLDPSTRCRRLEDYLSAFQLGYDRSLVEQATLAAPSPRPSRTRRILLLALLAVAATTLGGGLTYWLKMRRLTHLSAGTGTGQQIAPKKESGPDLPTARAGARTLVLAALRSPDAGRRTEVLENLRELGRPLLVEEVLQALQDRTAPAVSQKAALALGEMGAKAAIPVLRQELARSLDFKALDLAAALAQLGDPVGLAYLRQEATEPRHLKEKRFRTYYVRAALTALGRAGDRSAQTLQAMRRLVAEPFVDQRLKMRLLGHLAPADAGAREQLQKHLLEAEWPTRLQAAEALFDADPRSSRRVLQTALTQAPASQQLQAAIHLAHFRDATAAGVLVRFASSTDESTRKKSILALGRLGQESSWSRLAQALADPSQRVALAAAAALL